jgi:hypothetical protein
MDQLLSQHPGVVGLGEVANFFSVPHMERLRRLWVGSDGAFHCSCGQPWESCPLWSALGPQSGIDSNANYSAKYERLLKRATELFGPDVVLVDSSKSQAALDRLLSARSELGLAREAIRVILAVKDVRGFAHSIARRQDTTLPVIGKVRSFNWWLGSNRSLAERIANSGAPWIVGHYDKLCANPSGFSDNVYAWLGLPQLGTASIDHTRSHIALGNKDMLLRNNSIVRYDDRWRSDKVTRMIYRLHLPARRLNETLKREAAR